MSKKFPPPVVGFQTVVKNSSPGGFVLELPLIFSTAFLVGFSGAMMPGPLLTVTISAAARRGFAAGPLIVLGHGILEAGLVVALSLGLAGLLTGPVAAPLIALVGGLFLVYMGQGMVRDAGAGRVGLVVDTAGAAPSAEGGAAVGRGPGLHPVPAGVLVSLSNPYWSLWWATVGLGYITLSLHRGLLGLACFFSGHILSDLVWYSLVAAAVAGGRRFLSDRVYRAVLVVCGVFLFLLGGYFVYLGLRKIF